MHVYSEQNRTGFARGRFEWLKWRYSSLVTYFNLQAVAAATLTGSITYVSICVSVCAARLLEFFYLPPPDFRLPTSTFRIPTPAFSRLPSCIHGMRHAAYICITVTK